MDPVVVTLRLMEKFKEKDRKGLIDIERLFKEKVMGSEEEEESI